MTSDQKNYTETAPSRHMLRWAEQFWQFSARDDGHSIILPDARSDIMFRYRVKGRKLTALSPIFTAPSMEPFTVEYAKGDCWVGARLKPEHTASLCSFSPTLLDVGSMRGQEAIPLLSELGVEIHNLRDQRQLQRALQVALGNLPAKQLFAWLKPAIDRFHLTGGRAKIADIASALNISTRQLHRGFLKHVGVSPKDYCAIIRFHRSLRLLERSNISIADVAFESGYADQSHMTREYARFGGFSPNQIPPNLSLPGLPV